MIRNYFKIAFRVFAKEKANYAINSIGLALGIAVLLFILIYVQDEYSVDSYHSKADRIYRVYEKDNTKKNDAQYQSLISHQVAGALKSEFPEIEETANLIYLGTNSLKYGDNLFDEKNYTATSPSIFKIWDFEVVEGNLNREINGSALLVLTETCAKKLFGNESAVGKYVYSFRRFETIEVMAVIKDMPKNSSYQFSSLYVSNYDHWGSLNFFNARWLKDWDDRIVMTWLLLKESANTASIMKKKEAFLQKHYKEGIRDKHDFYLQNIKNFHFQSKHINYEDWGPPITLPFNNKTYVNVILLVGILIIIISGLNYVNLSSVQAIKRSKEAGVRTAIGASRKQLIQQLYAESFITTLLAYLLAITIIMLSLNQFNSFVDKAFSLKTIFSIWPYHAIIFVTVWLASSIIPSIHFATSGNLMLMKKAFVFKGDKLRKGFLAFQYCISLMLIIGTIVLLKQLRYVQSKDIGFNKDKLMTLEVSRGPVRSHFKTISQTLTANSNISEVSASSSVPFDPWSLNTVGITKNLGQDPQDIFHFGVDENWLSTYGITLVEGRNFSGNVDADVDDIIINEKAVTAFNLTDNPIGKTVYLTGRDTVKVNVIGIVKDIHFQSLYDEIKPMVLTCWSNPFWRIGNLTVKYSGNPAVALKQLEAIQKEYEPERPANIFFMDKEAERFYKADNKRSRLLLLATIVSILVALFGLFGIINFTAEILVKEISIRKVLGAKYADIVKLLIKDYVIILVGVIVIAIPIAYAVLNKWLNNFTYRIDLTPKIFITALVLILIASSITILFKILKLLRLNPIVKLKEE